MSAEDIVKALLGLFGLVLSASVGLVINAVRDLRRKLSDNTEKLHMKIDANAKEVRDGYVRSTELAEVKMTLREINENVGALTRELIKHRLHSDQKG